jgi:hypothetical protein
MIVVDEEEQFLHAVDVSDISAVQILLEMSPNLVNSARNIVSLL